MTNPLFSFIHVTDTHLSNSVDVVTPFVESVNVEQYHPRPDFIVFGGDNINGSKDDGAVCEREMPMLRNRLEELQVPYYVICHNHDTWGESCRGAQFRRYFGDRFDCTVELPDGFTAICVSGMYVDGEVVSGIADKVSWLDDTLGEMRSRKVLLFSHAPLFPARKPVPESHRPMLKHERWEASNFCLTPERSGPVRDAIARNGNVIAHYSGHCHVHSVTESAGTHYITTAALATQPWEYRYVEVYSNRMAHSCFRPHESRNGQEFWTKCFDEDHPDVTLYHNGLPEERQFVIRI